MAGPPVVITMAGPSVTAGPPVVITTMAGHPVVNVTAGTQVTVMAGHPVVNATVAIVTAGRPVASHNKAGLPVTIVTADPKVMTVTRGPTVASIRRVRNKVQVAHTAASTIHDPVAVTAIMASDRAEYQFTRPTLAQSRPQSQ